jgi:hypothetical protein
MSRCVGSYITFCTPFVQHASHHIGVWLHSEHFVFCFFAQHSIRCELLLLCRIAASNDDCSAVGMDDALKREPLTAGVRRLLPNTHAIPHEASSA